MFLVTYFNNLFHKGIYHRDWDKAIIVPNHKKGNANLPDNYRGVSLLSIISVSVRHYMLHIHSEQTAVRLVGGQQENR